MILFVFDVILTSLFTSLPFCSILYALLSLYVFMCVCVCAVRDLEQSSIERKPSHIGAAVSQSHEDAAAAVHRAKPLKSPGSADRRDDNKVCSVV